MRKLLAAIMAATLLISLTACGNGEEQTETTTANETTTVSTTVAQATTTDDEQNSDATTTSGSSVTTTAGATTTAATTTAASGAIVKPVSTEEIIKCYSDAIQKCYDAKPAFSKSVTTSIVKDVTGDSGITKLLNINIEAVNLSGRRIVENFLGIGENKREVEKGTDIQKDNIIIAGKLLPSDLKSATCEEVGNSYKLTMDIINEENPVKASSAIGRFTYDWKAEADVRDALNYTDPLTVTIDKVNVNTHDVSLVALIDKTTGLVSEITTSMQFDARLEKVSVKLVIVPVGGGEWGEGTGKTVTVFKDFKW